MTDSDARKGSDGLPDLGGFLDGMANILGKLGELADKGQELKKSGSFGSEDGKSPAGSYGVSVRFGAGSKTGQEQRVAPINRGTAKPTRPVAKPSPDAREPHADVFHESDHILIVAEMPGVPQDQIEISFEGTSMRLVGRTPRVLFEKCLELPREFRPDDVEVSVNNGVAEIRLSMNP